MSYENLRNVDLNLLLTFNALMEERSITGAARRMFIGQPAMSRAVDRLQTMFKDDLLVRTTRGYEPTPRASIIYGQVRQALQNVDAMFSESEFNPAKVNEVFRIESTGLGAVVLLPRLIQLIAERAPGISIEIITRTIGFDRLQNNDVDLVLSPSMEMVSEADAETQHLRYQYLFRDKLVCLMRVGHPLLKRRLTFTEYVNAKHLSHVRKQEGRRSPILRVVEHQPTIAKSLERLGRKLSARVRVPSFFPIACVLESTDLIATVPLHLARQLKTPKTRIVLAPVEFRSFTYFQVWHTRYESIPVHKWIRGVLRTLASRII